MRHLAIPATLLVAMMMLTWAGYKGGELSGRRAAAEYTREVRDILQDRIRDRGKEYEEKIKTLESELLWRRRAMRTMSPAEK